MRMFRMMRMMQPGAARLAAAAMSAVAIALAVLAGMPQGLSTARGAEAVPGLTGTDRPDEVVQARQLVMDGIDADMMAIDLFGAGKDYPLAELTAHADRISTLLTAFPHLFPPQTKPGPAADGSPSPTTATPAIWEHFDDFYGKTQAAAKIAYDASTATTADKFKEQGATLRAACDGCHAQYMHVEGPHP
jgi:cytochrome c556